jgi:hypothetical protein
VTDSASANPLAKFAELHGLSFAATAKLPQQGATLTHDDRKVEGAASGKLPGGIDGTLVHFTYTYTYTDSDNHTHTETRRFTLVVTQIPESIGFLPYFGFTGSDSKLSPLAGGEDMAGIDLGDREGLKHAHASAYKGTSENWLAQLLSPALVDWLARSEDDFGVELANGVLCAGRDGYLNDPKALETVCEDAAHITGAIREESLEEVGTDAAGSDAAKDPDAVDPHMEAALKELAVDAPADTTAALGAYSGFVRRSPATFFGALKTGVLIALVLNVPGIAVPILLATSGQYALLAAIEAVLIGLIFFFSFRKRVRDNGKKYAAEAFYRAYAAAHELTIEEPLHFAATHAEAKLPFKPDRVFSGPLPGAAGGSLVLAGDGSKRSDRIAVVGGPDGPFAEAELKTAAPSLSAKDLDGYTKRLIAELLEDLATRPSA